LYFSYGRHLTVEEKGNWSYISERSASIAWVTNLPAVTYVEYGKTSRLGQQTELPERYFFNHIHYLRDLDPDTQYFYKLVSVDEEGNQISSPQWTFRTQQASGAIYIPGELGKAPFVLDRPDTKYIVTEDIIAEGTAFDIRAGGIVLDLGAHTII